MSTELGAPVQAVVDAGGADAARVMQQVEERMTVLVSQNGQTLGEYGRETILAGGKRLRPLLACVASGVPVVQTEPLVRSAVAVELVHAATLVHDDVLDGSSLRRGRPTVVASGGRLMATATGDLLFSRAFAELSKGGAIEPVRVLSTAASSLVLGELMQREDAWNVSVSEERYLERCRLKTGVLFRAACELGVLAGLDDSGNRFGSDRLSGSGVVVAALGSFGEMIGVAFQLLDDILDVTGPPERTGKPRGADLLDGTVTLPLIEARRRDPSLVPDLRAVSTPEQAAAVCDQIEAGGGLASSRAQALGFVARAKAVLPDSLPSEQRAALELVADGVVERYA